MMLYGSMGVVKRENGPIVRDAPVVRVDSLSRTYITDTSLVDLKFTENSSAPDTSRRSILVEW